MPQLKRAFFGHGNQILVTSVFVRFSNFLYKKLWKSKSYLENKNPNKIGVVKGAENEQKVKIWDFGGFCGVFRGLNPLQSIPLKKI